MLPLSGQATSAEEVKFREQTEFEIPIGFLESAGANIELSAKDTPTASVLRWYEMKQLEDQGPMMKPEELNARNPDLGGIYKEPMNEKTAEYIAKEHRERRRLQSIIDRGPEGGIYGVTNFVAGMVPHALDPIGLGASLVTSGLASAAISGTRFARALGYAAKGVSREGSFIRDVGEGFLGNLAVDAAITQPEANKELRDYETSDVLMNSVAGALGFAGVKYAGLKAFDKIKMKPEDIDVHADSSVGQMLQDKKVITEPLNPNKELTLDDGTVESVPKTEQEVRTETESSKARVLSRDGDVDYLPETKVDYDDPLVQQADPEQEFEVKAQEVLDDLKAFKDQEILQGEDLSAFEKLSEEIAANEKRPNLFLAAVHCLTGGG